ncbi:hypothetical protein BDV95DRAFT_603233 [Massariosphaeria phaeospora]|uniref:Uncharacterized protein n=1 Tax=Massariosphaeria phaeospora TaxID=100035 RepID=A0A7C8IC53_9PLEO|nr:hypothetical protein BDV95DRAFT_603233 [Massariosphaeria phaeospora]
MSFPLPIVEYQEHREYKRDMLEQKALEERTAAAELSRIQAWQARTAPGNGADKPLPTEKPLPPLPEGTENHDKSLRKKPSKLKGMFRLWKTSKDTEEQGGLDEHKFEMSEGNKTEPTEALTALPPVAHSPAKSEKNKTPKRKLRKMQSIASTKYGDSPTSASFT